MRDGSYDRCGCQEAGGTNSGRAYVMVELVFEPTWNPGMMTSGKIDFEYVVIFKKALPGTSCRDMLLYILN